MKFYGQIVDGCPLDKFLYERYYSQKAAGFFIECGAGDGLYENTCKFFENLGWAGVNVEPFSYNYDKLIHNRPDSFLNLNVALSDIDGEATFTSSRKAFNCGSIGSATPFLRSLNTKDINHSVVTTTTYKKLVTQYGITKVDLFVLDVEGHELQVVDGMDGTTIWPSTIVAEYGHCGLDPITARVTALGYSVDHVDSVNAFYVRSA